jgi:hypothetical protein
MNATLLLRVAAALAAIQGVVHGGFFISAKPRSEAETAMVTAMKSGHFFAGGTRGYWDMYFGYGLIAALTCLIEAVLLWQAASIAAVQPALARPLVAVLLMWNVAHALIVWRYFAFPIPIAFDALVAVCLSWWLFAQGH